MTKERARMIKKPKQDITDIKRAEVLGLGKRNKRGS